MTDTIRLSDSQTLQVISSTPELLELESTWTTSPKPPPMHWHPHQRERFEMLEGKLTVEIGHDTPRVLGAGDVLDIPARTAHRMWNADPATARASWLITPARRTEEMFRYMAQGTNGLRGLRLIMKYRNEFRLGRPKG